MTTTQTAATEAVETNIANGEALLAALTAPVDVTLNDDIIAGVPGNALRIRIAFATEATVATFTDDALFSDIVSEVVEDETLSRSEMSRDEFIARLTHTLRG